MLAEMTGSQLMEWQVFSELEPEPSVRADYHNAHMVRTLIRSGKPLTDYLLRFGDEIPDPTPMQDLAYQERILDGWIFAHNATLLKKGA
jgi:hypothetical protein